MSKLRPNRDIWHPRRPRNSTSDNDVGKRGGIINLHGCAYYRTSHAAAAALSQVQPEQEESSGNRGQVLLFDSVKEIKKEQYNFYAIRMRTTDKSKDDHSHPCKNVWGGIQQNALHLTQNEEGKVQFPRTPPSHIPSNLFTLFSLSPGVNAALGEWVTSSVILRGTRSLQKLWMNCLNAYVCVYVH